MKRVLALAGAIFLIAAAIVVRAVIVDDDESAGGDDRDDGDLVVACIPELEEACEAIEQPVELRIEDPGETIAALAAGEEIDAWVTLDPWPDMAEESEGQSFFPTGTEPVAVSDLVLLVRTSAIPPSCGEPATWTCLTTAGTARVSVPSPSSALGRLVLAHAVNDFRPGFAGNELRDDFELGALIDELDTAADPVADMLLLPDPDATGTTAADVASRVEGSREDANLGRFTGASPASVAVVVAGPRADRIAGEPSFTNVLEELGWDLRPDAATEGLPDAGVLVALAEVAP